MTATQAELSGLYAEGIKSFESAMRAGIKIQEDLAKSWADSAKACSGDDMARRAPWAAGKNMIPLAQKSAEECLGLIEATTRSSLELMRRAAAMQPPEDLAQCRAKGSELWEATLGTIRANTQAVIEAGNKIMNACEEMGKKTADEARPMAKAAK